METRHFILKNYKETGRIFGTDVLMIEEAAGIIRAGGLIAFPTETVYGLGGDALNPESSLRIYRAKGRPQDNPLIVHISDLSSLKSITKEVPKEARLLMENFWPGPMTLIFKKADIVPVQTSGGLDTIAVRYPSHPVAQMLISKAKVPIAAPSANLSGRPSCTCASDCIEDLEGKVEVIIDGGPSVIGLESSIIDISSMSEDEAPENIGNARDRGPILLRPGAITREMMEEALKEKVSYDPAILGPISKDIRPSAPGMKYRHYAPKASMVLVSAKNEQDPKNIVRKIAQNIPFIIEKASQNYRKIALLCTAECIEILGIGKSGDIVPGKAKISLMDMGSIQDPEKIAHDIFNDLRECDRMGVDFIIAQGLPEEGLYLAVMNRLKKASAFKIIEV